MNALTKNIILFPFNLLYKVSPELTLKALFLLKKKKKLDLKNPKTFNQKLQWIKLYDKNPLMPVCCDKYTVRKFVEEQGCGDILNELYWSGFDPDEIPYDSLPEKFVIKVTHGSTFNIIVKNKAGLDRAKTAETLRKWLKAKFIPCYGEWFYGVEKPRIIVEKFIEDDSGDLKDYKVYCFNGEPRMIHVHSGRFTDHRNDIYDPDWNYMAGKRFAFENSQPVPPPEALDQLLRCSKILCKNFLHVRTDFYIANGKLIFGELTFTDGSGFDPIYPYSFDEEVGSWLKLPERK